MIGDVSLSKEDWTESLTGSTIPANMLFDDLVAALLDAFLIELFVVVMNELIGFIPLEGFVLAFILLDETIDCYNNGALF